MVVADGLEYIRPAGARTSATNSKVLGTCQERPVLSMTSSNETLNGYTHVLLFISVVYEDDVGVPD